MRVFACQHEHGHAPDVRSDPRAIRARKRLLTVQVAFATQDGLVRTDEGDVRTHAGDAIITGPSEEQWPVSRRRFETKYRPLPPAVPGQAGAYQSLALPVLALPMAEPFEVVLADGVSRLHGHAGDWLIDYGDGSLGVVAAGLFDTFYQREGGASGREGARRPRSLHALIKRILLLGARPLRASRPSAPAPPDRLRALVEATETEHQAFNQRAVRYGDRYRSAYWSIYLLSALAVLCAAMPFALGWNRHDHPMHAAAWVWALLELIVIGSVGVVYWRGHRGRWQAQWLAARTHAELARYCPVVAPLVDFDAPYPAPSWYARVFDPGRHLREADEVDRLCQRLEPLARATLALAWNDPGFVRGYASWACGILAGQRAYHQNVAGEQRALSHRIHAITAWLFGLTAAAAGLHIFVHWGPLLLATIFFPALGAALHGALAQSESHRLELSSERLVQTLERSIDDIQAALRQTDLQSQAQSVKGSVRAAVDLILQEHQDWHLLVRPHQLKLG